MTSAGIIASFDCGASGSNGLKIPFAFHVTRRRFVDATMVESGEKCGCTCPGCGDKVIAKHRRKRNVPHFSHHEGSQCPGAFETSLHQAAKQVMAELDEIALPPTDWGPMPPFHFFATQPEFNLRSFKPDVLARDFDENRLAIEIRVTHEVDLVKQEKIKASALDCIEFNLSKVSRQVTYETLAEGFRANAVGCHWVYHHGVRLWREEAARFAAEAKEEALRQVQLDRAFQENLERERRLQKARLADQARWDKWGSEMGWAND